MESAGNLLPCYYHGFLWGTVGEECEGESVDGRRRLSSISMRHICMKIRALFRHSKLNLLAYLVLTAE